MELIFTNFLADICFGVENKAVIAIRNDSLLFWSHDFIVNVAEVLRGADKSNWKPFTSTYGNKPAK